MDKREIAKVIQSYFQSYYTLPQEADLAFVFGRKDPRLAGLATDLYLKGCVKRVLFTGGVRKDSGDLKVSEAMYLAEIAKGNGVHQEDILVEAYATNGGENSRFGMASIKASGITHERIILIAYPASLVRLWAAHLVEAQKIGFEAEYQLCSFPMTLPLEDMDVDELIAEFRRLMDWPAKGWAIQLDLPPNLVAAVQVLPK